MSEISLGQFIKSAIDYSLGKAPANQPPPAESNESFHQMQQSNLKNINETVQNMQRNLLQRNDIIQTQMQLKLLNDFERVTLLRDLFNFPKDMKELMEMLMKTASAQNLTNKDLNALLSQKIDISKLMQLLQANGKGAEEKLAKLIVTLNKSGIYETRQLKEMTTLINACIPMADATPAAMMKSLLIMYLPWLPLPQETGLNLGFEEEEKKSSDSQNAVTIMITTKNYGQIKVMIYLDNNDLNIEINCIEEFPRKEFHQEIKKEATGFDLTSGVNFTVRKSQNEEEKNTQADIKISKSAKVSPHLLLIIHTIINLVLEFDKKAQLVEDRSKKTGGN